MHAGEDRRLDEELDGGAADGPHVDALVIERRPLTRSLVHLVAAHEHLGSAIIPRLNVRVHLLAVEGCVAKVNKFHVHAVLSDQDVLRLDVAMDQVGALARN